MTVAASVNVHLLIFSLPFVKSPYSAVCEKHLLSVFIPLPLDCRSWSSENASEPGVGWAGAVFPHGEALIDSLNSINPDP